MHICNQPIEIESPTGYSPYIYINGVHVVWGQQWVRLPDGRVYLIRWNE